MRREGEPKCDQMRQSQNVMRGDGDLEWNEDGEPECDERRRGPECDERIRRARMECDKMRQGTRM